MNNYCYKLLHESHRQLSKVFAWLLKIAKIHDVLQTTLEKFVVAYFGIEHNLCHKNNYVRLGLYLAYSFNLQQETVYSKIETVLPYVRSFF